VDTSFIEVPRQRNTKEQTAKIKQDETPEEFLKSSTKLSKKDMDTRWTK
jgi:hypothetical protein